MNFEEFKLSLSQQQAPAGLSQYLEALWYDARSDWNRAHDIAQDIADSRGSLIHAYLHRKEGDLSNAGYWYRRAGRTMPAFSLEKEWEEIVREMLALQ